MAFRIGMKVVCIDDRPSSNNRPFLAVKGEVYTIAALVEINGKLGLLFKEISPGIYPGWLATTRRFRPVVSTKTGMAILEQIRRDVTNKILRPICHDEQV